MLGSIFLSDLPDNFISFGKTPGFAGGLIEFDSSWKTFHIQCYKLVKITKQETLCEGSISAAVSIFSLRFFSASRFRMTRELVKFSKRKVSIVNAIMFCDYEGHDFATDYALRVQNFTAFTITEQ